MIDRGEDPDAKMSVLGQVEGKGKSKVTAPLLSEQDRERKSKDVQEQLGDLEAKVRERERVVLLYGF